MIDQAESHQGRSLATRAASLQPHHERGGRLSGDSFGRDRKDRHGQGCEPARRADGDPVTELKVLPAQHRSAFRSFGWRPYILAWTERVSCSQ